MKFEIKKSKDPEQPWYFTIENKGKTLCTSETYHNHDDCYAVVISITMNAADAEIHSPSTKKKQ